jgi:hypothetical protein
MTVVSETLPATDRMGYFSIFLMLRIVTSALATILTIYEEFKNKTDDTNIVH